MTKRCRDTNFYAGGEKCFSGQAWVVDPERGERLYVVSGRSKVSKGRVHVGSLTAGTRIYYSEDAAGVLLDPSRLYGRKGRTPAVLNEADRRRAVRASMRLSWYLRHGAREAGLAMDEAGWVRKDDLLPHLKCSEEAFQLALLHNSKDRFEVYGEKIRAAQGHSTEGTPVTLEALEASWEKVAPVGALYHATRASAAESIKSGGLSAGGRTHVHLSSSIEATATTSGRDEVLIVIDAARLGSDGINIFRAGNGIILVREVPVAAIAEVRLVPESPTGAPAIV